MAVAPSLKSPFVLSSGSISSPLLRDPSLALLNRKIKEAVCSRWFIWGKGNLKQELNALDSNQLKNLVESVLLDPLDQAELVKTIDCLVDLLSMGKLQEVVRHAYPTYQNALQTALQMCEEAKDYLERTKKVNPSLVWSYLSSIRASLFIALEGLLSAFGIAEFFQPAEDEMHAQYRGYKLFNLIQVFSLITTCLVPILGANLVIPIGMGILLSFCALSLVYVYLRPMPSRILKTTNWSEELFPARSPSIQGRRSTLDEIANTLITSNQVKTHVMLLGKTGVGKTETAKAFTQATEVFRMGTGR